MTREEALRRIDRAVKENSRSLDLAGLGLTEVPREIARCTQLKTLVLGKWDEEKRRWVGNPLQEFPDVILQLSNLTSLNLSRNQLSQIPESIAQLSNLTRLYLGENQLSQIPESIAQLSNLTSLNLSFNQLSQIPESIAQLSNLTSLDLGSNQIGHIPDVIGAMATLKTLDLRGNPIPIPPEILGDKELWDDPGDLQTILNVYFQTRDPNATEALNEAKLLIVGEGEAGKTTLAQKLLDPDYELLPQEPSTEGIDISSWEFELGNDVSFRTHLWDFGGQEIYHATHQFFLTDRSLYILLVDDRRENPNLCYWMSAVELLGNKSPVLLVQNEKQDRRCEINTAQLRADFDNLEKNYGVNLATNRGLEDLKNAIQKRISTLDHVGTPIPKRWANVRHAIENYAQRQTHIEVFEFYDLCVNQGFQKSDKHEMNAVGQYLHDLGIILHFQKDAVLKHLVILRPDWATNAVYKVTDNENVIANHGYFNQADLQEIWSEPEYQNLQDELLQLMKNFKLCYKIRGLEESYIAPQRLPVEPPIYDWDETDNSIVRYKYEFMPKGIITQFIVEMHRLVWRNVSRQTATHPAPNLSLTTEPEKRPDIVWRDGVVLTDGYAYAEVIENYHQREIRIRVRGNPKQSLLERIRQVLWQIHCRYDNRLKFQEFIPCNCSQCKGSSSPHLYDFDALRRRLSKRRYEVECEQSYQMVNVRGLMNEFPDYSRPQEREHSGSDRVKLDESRHSQEVNCHITIGNNMTQDSSETNHLKTNHLKTNNFNGPMSGVIGSDNAQVSHNTFTQTNNANTAELLQLVATLRQTTENLPEAVREDLIIDIEDIETEIQKPENERNQARLKKRLMAIIATAIAIATPIAATTDFANTALDLGQKLGFELTLPSGN